MTEPHKDKPIVVNPTRFDPYKNFKFRLAWEGRVVAGVSNVSGLPLASKDAIKLPGYQKYENITLERGVIHDSGFQNWLNGTAKSGLTSADLVLEIHNEAGRLVSSWTLYNCSVSQLEGAPSLDGQANELTIVHLVLHAESIKLNT